MNDEMLNVGSRKTLPEARKLEIAYKYCKAQIVRNGLPGETLSGFDRELGNLGRAMQMAADELRMFFACVLRDIGDDITSEISPTALLFERLPDRK